MWNENLEGITVVKRSGQRVEFNASKIAIAIKKAFDAVYVESDEKKIFKVFEGVLTFINENYKDRKTINVEDVQNIIEDVLKKQKCDEVYWSFHNYREKRAASRMVFNEKQQHKFAKAIEIVEGEGDYFNLSLTPDEGMSKYGKIISSEYVKSHVLDNKALRAIEEGNIYIHDLDYFSLGYISSLHLKLDVDYGDKHLDAFISKIRNACLEVSNEVALDSIDSVLIGHVLDYFKDKLNNYLEKYLKLLGVYDFVPFKKYETTINRLSSIEVAENDLKAFMTNTMLQNVFASAIEVATESVTYYIKEIVSKLLNIGSKTKITISLGYDDCAIARNIRYEVIDYLNSNQYIEKVHVIFKLKKTADDEYLTKLSKLIINNKNVSLSFMDASYNKGLKDAEYFSNGMRIFESVGGEKDGTGRMVSAKTSINMARIALKCTGKNRNYFYGKLESIMELVKNTLLLQFETIGNKNRENYKYLFRGNILGDERLENGQKIRKILKSGTLNVGLVGLKECVSLLESDADKQYKLLIDILKKMNNKCKEFQEEYKLNFVLCETTDQVARQKLIGIDKSIYGTVKGVTDKPMYSLLYELHSLKDLNRYATVSAFLKGGNMLIANVSKNPTETSVVKLIREFNSSDVGYVKINGGKSC